MIRPGRYLSVDEYERRVAQAQEAAMKVFGPYQEERQAYADAPPYGTDSPKDRRDRYAARLREVCAEAGVELGDYDEDVIRWLARWEPQIVQAVAGLISRAGAK